MGQKDAQRFSGTDEITERAGFVGENKFFVRHLIWIVKGVKRGGLSFKGTAFSVLIN
jgi:hypothetical protein